MGFALRKEGILALFMVELTEVLQEFLMFFQLTGALMQIFLVGILLPLGATMSLKFTLELFRLLLLSQEHHHFLNHTQLFVGETVPEVL